MTYEKGNICIAVCVLPVYFQIDLDALNVQVVVDGSRMKTRTLFNPNCVDSNPGKLVVERDAAVIEAMREIEAQ